MGFLPFFLVIIATVLFSAIFRRYHLPWVLALIVAGVVIGPYGFDVVPKTDTLSFIGEIGLIFLMFMAGLETNFSSFKEYRREITRISLLNGLVPFAIGYAVGYVFDFETLASLLLGAIFMSSSIAVVIPTLESAGLLNTKLGKTIMSSTIVEDITSLILLSIILQSVSPTTALPLPSFYMLLIVILVAFRYGLPKIRALIPQKRDQKDLFESEVRIIFALLLGTVVTFELLGLHSIIAGFFAGLVLSDSIKSDILMEKLRTMSYGIFIPVFFVIVGMETDITVFGNGGNEVLLVLAVVLGSMLSKFTSGWFGARLSGFTQKEAVTVGVATKPSLSTTLAVAFAAVEFGLLDPHLITAIVILSIVSTIVAPIAMKRMYPEAPV